MGSQVLDGLYETIAGRRENPSDNSYTCYLFREGIDKILKKIGEESAEVIIAAKNRAISDVVYESADLIFHLWVMLNDMGIAPEAVYKELESRMGKTGNLKEKTVSDKNT